MGRQVGDSSTMVNSSIALLQERFKELQRVKEKRQEKELLKLFSDSSQRHTTPPTPSASSSPSSSSTPFQPSSFAANLQTPPHPTFFNRTPTASPSPSPPRVRVPAPPLLSLGLYSSSESQRYYHSYDHQSLRGGAPVRNSQRTVFQHSDVDTSLHL